MGDTDSRSALSLDIRDDEIAVLTFDVADRPVNTFSQARLVELEARVAELEGRSGLRGLVFRSGKPGNFIAGADLKELLAENTTPQGVRALIERGHTLFARIGELPFPTVAAINGICVGGGLECVLAFDYRLVSDDPRTEVGAPEVKIGIIPGWGGTQRLPRLVGIDKAIEMNCGGNSIRAAEVVDVGLAWAMVPNAMLLDEAVRLIGLAHEEGDWTEARRRRAGPMGLSPDAVMFTAAVARGYLLGQTKGHYPAPIAALEAMLEGCNLPLAEGLGKEIEKILPLIGSATSRNLIAMFFMDQRVRKDPGVADVSIKPRPIGRTGVLGAGQMGAGITFAHARRGLSVTMTDLNEDLVAAGLDRIRQPMRNRIKAGRMAPGEMIDALAKVRTHTDVATLADCDLIVEAVIEQREAKLKVFKALERIVSPDAVIASNTSTISISSMAEELERPDRFVGMHFFNPVDRMQLVEVIRGAETSDETVAAVVAHAKALNKKPIVVNDCAGFVVNRCLFPYMNEAILLVEEGTDMERIDKAITRFGLPMGPLTLADLVGLDVMQFAGSVVAEAYPDRTVSSRILPELLERDRRGCKSGAGFYAYDPRKKKKRGVADGVVSGMVEQLGKKSEPADEQTIQERLLLAMLAEAVRLLEEDIVRSPADVDFGLVYGIGFPPFRGGVLRWCDSMGAADVVERLGRYASLGPRYSCPRMLEEMARTGGRFFSD